MIRRIVANVIRKTFNFWQSIGIHITLNDFYQPVPDTSKLEPNLWKKNINHIGINYNESAQLSLLSNFKRRFKKEYDKFPKENNSSSYYINNGMFESVDAEILYSFVRDLKPKKIIEIGSGYSSLLISDAIEKNLEESKKKCEYLIIDPYPHKILSKRKNFKLIKNEVQKIPLREFKKLGKNDILFIDSSHVSKIGSDVNFEYLEILPTLKKDVIVHMHDIFLPEEYPKESILNQHMFWNEQYILQAFLLFNNTFEILWAGNYMRLKHPKKLKKSFSSYDQKKVIPGSFWIKK